MRLIYPSPDDSELADAICTSNIRVLTHPNREGARVLVEVPRRVRKGWTETEASVRLTKRLVKEAGTNYVGGRQIICTHSAGFQSASHRDRRKLPA